MGCPWQKSLHLSLSSHSLLFVQAIPLYQCLLYSCTPVSYISILLRKSSLEHRTATENLREASYLPCYPCSIIIVLVSTGTVDYTALGKTTLYFNCLAM